MLNTVKIVPIDLAGVTATLKNPLKLEEVSTKTLTANDLVFTKNGKELELKPAEVTVTITKGTYDKIGTYTGAIVMEPFIKMGGEVGRDVKVWRDISKGASEAEMEKLLADAASMLRTKMQ